MGTVRYTTVNGQILSEERNGVHRDYVPDVLGSTAVLLDNTQTQTDTFSFWPYGEVASRTGTTATPFQFVGTKGYFRDSSSRTYVRARTLDTKVGRWMTQDPIGFDGGDFNLYRYVGNRPVLAHDVFGRQTFPSWPPPWFYLPITDPTNDPTSILCCLVLLLSHPEIMENLNLNAVTVCCDGQPKLCRLRQFPGETPGMSQCISTHEGIHGGQINCLPGCSYVPEPSGIPEENRLECAAYQADLECAKKNKRECEKIRDKQQRKNCNDRWKRYLTFVCEQLHETCGFDGTPYDKEFCKNYQT